jgi:FkbM family methyltransferase
MPKSQDLLINKLNEICSWEVAILNRITDLSIFEKYDRMKKITKDGEYIDISYKDKIIHFFVPNYRTDTVQRRIVQTECFWEKDLLEFFENLVADQKGDYKGKIFVDAGANIGNHTLYFSKILKASKIYCFEPQKEIFNILQKNIKANAVNAECYNNVLSDQLEKFSIDKFTPYNFGGTNFIRDQKGEYSSLRLDDICLKDEIFAMKIDVEGHDFFVLKGAIKILEKYAPILWIEMKDEIELKINFLSSFGYVLAKKWNEDYFFYKK